MQDRNLVNVNLTKEMKTYRLRHERYRRAGPFLMFEMAWVHRPFYTE